MKVYLINRLRYSPYRPLYLVLAISLAQNFNLEHSAVTIPSSHPFHVFDVTHQAARRPRNLSSRYNPLHDDHEYEFNLVLGSQGPPYPSPPPPLPTASLKMNLSFAPNEEGDILNTTIRDSHTGSVMYTVDTSRSTEAH